MSTVHEIIDALGGVKSTATKIAIAQQTVNTWYHRSPPEIPPWHRTAIAQVAKSEGKKLSQEARAYLASRTRTPKASKAKPFPAVQGVPA